MSTVDTVIKSEEATQAGMRFFSAAELREITPSIPWLVRGVLRQESLCTLIGAPGAGKSFVALDLACCVAAGRSWHGHRVEQGPVFYIAGEGVEGLKLRLKAWEQQYGKTGEFFLSETAVALIDTKSVEEMVLGIANLALAHGLPRLIVIDTLARNMGRGDENSNSDMSVVINNVDRLLRNTFNAAVLIVHHSGHGERKRGRGASALTAAVDHEYLMENAGHHRLLTCNKSKDSADIEPIEFRLEPVAIAGLHEENGEVVTSCVLARTEYIAEKANRLSATEQTVLNALDTLLEEEGIAPPTSLKCGETESCPTKVTTLSEWRATAYTRDLSKGATEDAKRNAFKRAVTKLVQTKQVSLSGDYCWVNR